MTLRDDLIRDEGLRLKVYRCTAGKLTIGVGRNLEDLGITEAEAYHLLDNDIARVTAECQRAYPWFNELDEARRNVIVNMRFNMGPRLDGFVNTLAAVGRGDYAAAAAGMRKSLWYRQVGARAERLAKVMEGAT